LFLEVPNEHRRPLGSSRPVVLSSPTSRSMSRTSAFSSWWPAEGRPPGRSLL